MCKSVVVPSDALTCTCGISPVANASTSLSSNTEMPRGSRSTCSLDRSASDSWRHGVTAVGQRTHGMRQRREEGRGKAWTKREEGRKEDVRWSIGKRRAVHGKSQR